MNRKAKYSEFCEKQYVPLMMRPFWLDAVCGAEGWDVCIATDQGGEVMGSLLYYLAPYKGFKIIKMPPLTDYSGLWLHYPDNLEKRTNRYGFEKEVCTELLRQLPKSAFFYQQWDPAITNWLPFFWQGFRQTTLYTFQLPLTKEEALFNNLKKTARKNIRKALQTVVIETSDDLEMLYRVANLSLERQQVRANYSFEILAKLDIALKSRALRTIYQARDATGHIHAAAYLVWDERRAYYLLSGADPAVRHHQAQYLVQWQAILDCIEKMQTFDFCGSMLEPVERALRAFGGELVPHFKITKPQNKLFQLAGILLNKEV